MPFQDAPPLLRLYARVLLTHSEFEASMKNKQLQLASALETFAELASALQINGGDILESAVQRKAQIGEFVRLWGRAGCGLCW